MIDREYISSAFDILEEEMDVKVVEPFVSFEAELAMWRGSERPRKVSPLVALLIAHGGTASSDAVGWLSNFLGLTRLETEEVIQAMYGGGGR